MIKKLTLNTNSEILNKLVEIHKNCVLETNSKFYNRNQIIEWVSTVNLKNIKDQLDNTTWITIENNHQILGFAQYCLKDGEIYQIQIAPDSQGQGYGVKLYNYIEKDFRNNSIKQITLLATLNAVSFYMKLGFKNVEEINFPLMKTEIKMIMMFKNLV